jgi:hypothetical protein
MPGKASEKPVATKQSAECYCGRTQPEQRQSPSVAKVARAPLLICVGYM